LIRIIAWLPKLKLPMKKNLILFVLLVFSINYLLAQQGSNFVKASFDGNIEKYFASRLSYPRDLNERNIKGRTILSFLINKKGEIESITIEDFPHIFLANEAKSILLSTIGKWKPTLENNNPTDFTYKIIINYHGRSNQSQPSKEMSLMFKDKSLKKIQKEEYKQALSLINEAIQINPFNAEYFKIRSQILSILNIPTEAELDMKSAIKFGKEILLNIDIFSYSVTRTTTTKTTLTQK
jgi:hypothetical protein